VLHILADNFAALGQVPGAFKKLRPAQGYPNKARQSSESKPNDLLKGERSSNASWQRTSTLWWRKWCQEGNQVINHASGRKGKVSLMLQENPIPEHRDGTLVTSYRSKRSLSYGWMACDDKVNYTRVIFLLLRSLAHHDGVLLEGPRLLWWTERYDHKGYNPVPNDRHS
jgi:hypothetical protein